MKGKLYSVFTTVLIIIVCTCFVFAQDSIEEMGSMEVYKTETFHPETEEAAPLQQSVQQEQYEQQTIEQHSFNNETWKKATGGLDYSDQRKPKPEEKKKDLPVVTPKAFTFSGQTIRLIAFVVLFAVLIIILLRAFGLNIFWGKKKSTKEKLFTLEEFNEHIPESELERMLREALGRNDYRLALRIYYLMAIKELAQRNMIHWRKEKTNFDYVTELRETSSYKGFKEVTLLFERVWYGELIVSENRFSEMSSRFRNFLTSLKSAS